MGVPKRPAPPLVTPGGHQCALLSRLCRPASHAAAGHLCSVPVGGPAAARVRRLAVGAAWGRSRAKPTAPGEA